MRQEPSIVRNWVYVFSRDLIPELPKHIELEHFVHTVRDRMSIGGNDKLLDCTAIIQPLGVRVIIQITPEGIF